MSETTRTTVDSLLPHTMPARLLTEVITFTSTSIETIARIPFDHPLVTEGDAAAILGVECGAQAAAALEALLRMSLGSPTEARPGRLVRVREATLLAAHLPVGVPLMVSAQMEGSAPPLAVYRVRVSLAGATLVHAVISTHSQGTQ